jgi:hypothetical protein
MHPLYLCFCFSLSPVWRLQKLQTPNQACNQAERGVGGNKDTFRQKQAGERRGWEMEKKTWFKMGKSPRVSSPNEPVAASAEGDKTALATHVLRDGCCCCCCCCTTISSATSLQPTPLTTGTDFLLTAVTSCQEWASLKLKQECEEGAKGEGEEEEEEEEKKKLRWALPSC